MLIVLLATYILRVVIHHLITVVIWVHAKYPDDVVLVVLMKRSEQPVEPPLGTSLDVL